MKQDQSAYQKIATMVARCLPIRADKGESPQFARGNKGEIEPIQIARKQYMFDEEKLSEFVIAEPIVEKRKIITGTSRVRS